MGANNTESAQRWSVEPLFRSDAPILSPHVLVVDDEPMILKLVASILRAQALGVSTAENGFQAVDLLRSDDNISLTILDWNMPGMSGETVLDHLVAIRPCIKAIVSSSDNPAEVLQAFSGRNVIRFIPKPFNTADLVSAVEFALSA